MKTWFEFPEPTRFARSGRADILYTPIFFANEGISGKFCLDGEWSKKYPDFSQLDARAHLIGKASLGFLSIGGRPVSSLDTRYALPSVGFRPIYTLNIMDLKRRVRLEDGAENRTPFQFRLPTSTLADLQQIASSLKAVTADTVSTNDIFKDISPALIVSVQYALVGTVHHEGVKVSEHDSEIRIFVSMDSSQAPRMSPASMKNNPLAELVQTGIVGLGRPKLTGKTSRRRDSLPLIRRMSRSNSAISLSRTGSSVQEECYLVVEIENTEPFVFRTRDEAAAAKFRITLTYHDGNSGSFDECGNEGDGGEVDQAPPSISANVTTLMKVLTSLTLEPIRPEDEPRTEDLPDDYFHLRSKIFPGKKTKLAFGKWEKKSLSSTTAEAVQFPTITEQDITPSATGSRINDQPQERSLSASGDIVLNEGEQDLSSQSHIIRHSTTRSRRSYTLPTHTTAPPRPEPERAPPIITIPAPPKRWTTSADLWLTHPITSTLTPSFVTPYISHLYTVSIALSLSADTSSTAPGPPSAAAKASAAKKVKIFKSLKGTGIGPSKPTIEMNVPVTVRYDLGLVPSYEIDQTLPEYDFSLPRYEDAVGFNPGALEALSQQPEVSASILQTNVTLDGAGRPPSSNDNVTQPINEATDIDRGGNQVESDIAYEARISAATRGRENLDSASSSNQHGPMSDNTTIPVERHAWRYAPIDTQNPIIGHHDDDDDDVLDMLMRRNVADINNQTTRRIYGDDEDSHYESSANANRESG